MTERLILDEMFAPAIAHTLTERGHDVIAVAEDPALRGMTDPQLFAWAAENRRRIVTENVRDFRPLLFAALDAGQSGTPLLFTSSRTFPRARSSYGALQRALESWLDSDHRSSPESWLTSPAP